MLQGWFRREIVGWVERSEPHHNRLNYQPIAIGGARFARPTLQLSPWGCGMRILALETTEKIGSVAVADDCKILVELDLDHTQRSAQSLAPAMQAALKQAGWRPGDVQLTAVSIGPGSFTGLRVGVTAAKVFAYAVGGEVLGVDTLEAIAAAAPDDVTEVSAAVDAQRGQVAARRFARRSDGWFEPLGPERLIDVDAWIEELPQGMAATGPALVKLADRLPSGMRVLDAKHWTPRASAVARLAARDYALGRRDDLWQLIPHYSRRSAAEEKLVQ
jgi:tRNA threonylcarbamoyladenosine biosynthesis protein TsaB